MKKIDQYMIKELFVPFLIGTFAVVLMFQANTYMALAKTLNMDNVPFKSVLQLLYYQTPFYLNMTLPVGTALGTSLAMSRIARESELTALRAAGVRILRVILPVGAFGILIAAGHFYMVEKIMPSSTQQANRLLFQIGALGYSPDVKTNTIINLRQFAASFGTVIKKGDDLDINKVLLIEQPEPDVTTLITAEKAKYRDGKWTFEQAYLRMLRGQDLITVKPLGTYEINERIIASDLFNPPKGEEQTIATLRESIAAGKKVGNDTKRLEVQLYEKFSLPASCIVFAFVAPIFAIVFARSGGFMGVLLSAIMVIVYYNAHVVSTQILSKFSFMPAVLAAWLTNILFIVLGLVAVRRLE